MAHTLSPDEAAMSCVPAWSLYTLPRRGSLVRFRFDLADILEDELERIENRQPDSALHEESDWDSDGTSLVFEEDDNDADLDYEPPADRKTTIDHYFPRKDQHASRRTLRPRPLRSPPRSPSPPTALPTIITSSHFQMLGFRRINWDDPRAFVDKGSRVGAFFIGPPVQRTAWERSIIQANHEMAEVAAFFDNERAVDNTLHGGITYNPHGLGRPENIANSDDNVINLAFLRSSKAIQEITSFQNAMLKQVAPRVWNCANQAIEALLDHDSRLHMPMGIPCREERQPSAFAEVSYQFSVPNSKPRLTPCGPAVGWEAVTALGNYDSTEGELVLWEDETMVRFPPGSTFLIPGGLLSYSFAGISEFFSNRMLIRQSLSGDIYDYVANGFHARPLHRKRQQTRDERRERAEKLLAMYPTVPEIDGHQYYDN